MRLRFLAAMLVLASLGIFNCGEQSTTPGDDTPRALSAAEEQVVDAYNAFGLSLFREIVAGEKPDNVFISPLSVSMALGMTANGAAGLTLEAMLNTLEFSGLEMQEVNESYRGLIDLLGGLDPETEFSIANSIWYRENYIFREEFLNTCRQYFDAVVRELDFGGEGAVDTINAWVEDKTNGKIEDILQGPIDPLVVMYLINAIYFLGTWTYEFDPALTTPADFHLPDGSTASCNMMQRPGEEEESAFLYYSDEEVQAVDLPYGAGWYSMTILLPQSAMGIDSFISGLTEDDWDAYTAGLEETQGRVYLPRFQLEYELLMNDVLISMGMGIAFDPMRADFSGMREQGDLFISRVIHKSYVDVNEEGTEAAAATVVEMKETAVDSFVMRMDRPFVFAIREKHSGTILFIGKVLNPGQGS